MYFIFNIIIQYILIKGIIITRYENVFRNTPSDMLSVLYTVYTLYTVYLQFIQISNVIPPFTRFALN